VHYYSKFFDPSFPAQKYTEDIDIKFTLAEYGIDVLYQRE